MENSGALDVGVAPAVLWHRLAEDIAAGVVGTGLHEVQAVAARLFPSVHRVPGLLHLVRV